MFSVLGTSRSWRRGVSCALLALAAVGLACADSPTELPPLPPPPPPAFSIDFRFVPGATPTDEQRQQLDDAAARWQLVVTGDLPSFQVIEPTSFQCERVTAPPMDEVVDDLVVWIDFGPIDGQGGVGAWAGVCVTRSNFLPVVSSILFDEADPFISPSLALHEFAHTLGFGEVWDEMGLLVDAVNPVNGGPGALEAVEDATVSSASPDENFGLPGASALSTNLVAGRNLGTWTSAPDNEELRAFLKFDLSGVQFGSPITRAQVVLHGSGFALLNLSSAKVELGYLVEPWDEASVTWNVQPALGPHDAAWTFSSVCSICAWEVATTVQDWLDGVRPNLGFYLALVDVETMDANLGFHSRHAADPSDRPQLFIRLETHFTGQNAIAQFDAAGGGAYTDPKVPVENDFFGRGESVDAHWRDLFFTGELMSSQAFLQAKLSAITIGALQDMGYEVDYTQADPFEVNNVP